MAHPDAARDARRGQISAWMPVAIMVVGLGVAASVFSAASEMDSSGLLVRFGKQYGRFPVGTQAGPFAPMLFDPFVDHRLRLSTVLLTAVYLSAVTAIGSPVVTAVRAADRWPRPVSWLAGFLPGYLMVIAPLQLLFAVMPVVTAARIATAALLICALLMHRLTIRRCVSVLTRSPLGLRQWVPAIFCSLGLVAFALVHRLEAGPFYLTQDSIRWFLVAATEQFQASPGSRLAQWNQQSDEWIFNAPLMFYAHTGRDFQFPFYATQSLSLASFSCLIFGVVHRLALHRKTLSVVLAMGAILGSTPSINPSKYIIIIGGSNPVLWTGHPGRHVGIVAPWVALLVLRRQRRSVLVALGLATLGLGFTSIQVLVYVVAAVAAAIGWKRLGKLGLPRIKRQPVDRASTVALIVSISAIVMTFWWVHLPDGQSTAVWWLLAATVAGLAGAVMLGATRIDTGVVGAQVGAARWFGAWLAVVLIGLVLSNNLIDGALHGRSRQALGLVFSGYNEPLLGRDDLGRGVLHQLSILRFSSEACENSIPCHSVVGFVASYGVLITLVLAAWFALGAGLSEAMVPARRATLLLLLAALAASLILVDFAGADGTQSNIYTRFLDVPYYGMLGVVAIAFAEARGRATVFAGAAVLTVWTAVPLVAMHWPEQMIENGRWLLTRLGAF